MPDRIEDILKKIHVLLAKSEAYHGSTDRVIISKRDMFRILEELNEAIDGLLDKCEATAMSRERARLDLEKQQADFIDKTRKRAEEINAASLMYTDNMLDDVKNIIYGVRERIEAELKDAGEKLDDLCSTIGSNKKDVMDKMRELKDSERYEKLLAEEREKVLTHENKDSDEGEEIEIDKPTRASYEIKIHDPGDTGITMFGKKRGPKKTKEEKQKILEEMKRKDEPADDTPPDVGGRHYNSDDFDLDREYFEFVEENEKEAEGSDDAKKGGKKGKKKGALDALFGRGK